MYVFVINHLLNKYNSLHLCGGMLGSQPTEQSEDEG